MQKETLQTSTLLEQFHVEELKNYEFIGRIKGVLEMEADGWLTPSKAIKRINQLFIERDNSIKAKGN